ncbi:hypothetical protein D3C81_841200 [compost metagenome]
MHGVLHVDAVRAHAGLAAVAELGRHQAVHGGVQVGIVKDDERRVAAQLQREALHGWRRLRHQDATDLGRPRERQLAHDGAARQHGADGLGIAGHHLEHAGGNAGPVRQFSQCEGGQRGQLGRFDDDGAPGCQGRACLAGDHRCREIPRRDGGADAHGLAQRDQALVGGRRGQHFAVHALGFLGKPFDKAGRVRDLAARLGQRLALLARHQVGQVVRVGDHQVEPAAQQVGAFLAGLGGPGALRNLGSGDGAPGLGRAQVGHLGDHFPGGRVRDVEGGAGVGANPLAIHIGQLFQ